MSAPTPHIGANKGDFAQTVLMPGDPLRAQYIAKTFLKNAVLVNSVRGVNGFTGEYFGKRVSVMASGMGMPSMGIYSYELFHDYEVQAIIRVGTAGAIHPELRLRDVVIGMGACTDSNYVSQFRLPGTWAPLADFELVQKAVAQARSMRLSWKVGNLLSSDLFYDDAQSLKDWQKMGVLAVEMEAAALYANAARAGKRALAICTISDCPFTGEACSPEERQTSFAHMMELALEIS